MFHRALKFALAVIALASSVHAFETRATAAYVVDLSTGTVLLEKNADTPLPPASMSKLMTINMLFEALDDGRVSMDTRFAVSERAHAMGGSTMFLNTTDRPTVDELIQGIIVQSGNDACVVVAEGLGGTEADFARMMTQRAEDLGMANSSFGNASGWPHPMQRMSMRDLGILATHLIEDFPEYYPYFALQEFLFDGRAPENRRNRNPLLGLGIGADGLKTGHTEEAGYGLVGSAIQGNRRIVFVITGLTSEAERAEEAERVVSWAFRQFSLRTVVEEGTEYANAQVWLGDADTVGMVAHEDVSVLIPALHQGDVTAEVSYTGPIEAPIMEGQELGHMTISLQDMPDTVVPLFAANAVGEAPLIPRLMVSADILINDVIGEQLGLF